MDQFNSKNPKLQDFVFLHKEKLIPFLGSQIVQGFGFSFIFGGAVWVTSNLFLKEILQNQEIEESKINSIKQNQNKVESKKSSSQKQKNLDKPSVLVTKNNVKTKKQNNFINKNSQKNQKEQQSDSFLIECSLFFLNPKIGDNVVVSKNINSQKLKSGMLGKIEKICIGNKAVLRFYKKSKFTRKYYLASCKPLYFSDD